MPGKRGVVSRHSPLSLLEASKRHGLLRFGILHKLFPDEAGAMVFRHQHGDSQIEAEHIWVVPVGQWIERVAEAVLRPHLFAIGAADMSQHADAIVKEKRKRTASGALFTERCFASQPSVY